MQGRSLPGERLAAGTDLRRLALFCCFLVLASSVLPRRNVGGVKVSGMELAFLPLMMGWAFWWKTGLPLRWPKAMPLFFVIMPLLMILSQFVPYYWKEDPNILAIGLVQSFRRVVPALFLLLLVQVPVSERDLRRIAVFLFLIPVLGALVHLALVNKLVPGVSTVNVLTSGYVRVITNLVGMGFIGDVFKQNRMAGNSGSPSIYGLLCVLNTILLSALYRQGVVGFRFFLVNLFIMPFLLLASAAKTAIAAFALFVPIALLRHRVGRLVVAVTILFGAFVVFLVQERIQQAIGPLFVTLMQNSETSGEGRLEGWGHAYETLSEEPLLFWLGQGWRTGQNRSGMAGWHNESLEFIMDFGVPLGLTLLAVMYFYIPFRIWSHRPSTGLPFDRVDILLIIFSTYFCGISQDVTFDPSVMIFLVTVFAIYFSRAEGA